MYSAFAKASAYAKASADKSADTARGRAAWKLVRLIT